MISPLRGGGKLADKIFNKYNITKEEREEVKNEIASGGGGGGETSKYKYYAIKTNLDKSIIKLLFLPIAEIIYVYYHYEDGTRINKCSSGMLVTDCNTSGSAITPLAFIDNIENFYIFGIKFKNYKEYVARFKDNLGVEFEDMFEEMDKAKYDELFDYYISNINS